MKRVASLLGGMLFFGLFANVFAQSAVSPTLPIPASLEMGSISGLVVDKAGQPVPGVVIGYLTATDIRGKAEAAVNKPPVPGSGYAAAIANRTPEDKQRLIESKSQIIPGQIYEGGTEVGTTDAHGAFTIKKLPADTYVVTAALKGKVGSAVKMGNLQIASQQPIILKAGDNLQLLNPIRLKQAAPPACAKNPQQSCGPAK